MFYFIYLIFSCKFDFKAIFIDLRTAIFFMLTLTLSLFSSLAKSQCAFEKEAGFYNSFYVKSLNYFEGENIALSSFGSCPSQFLERIGCNGDSIWKIVLPISYGISNSMIINNADSSIIVAAVDWGMDDVQMPAVAKLIVLNKLGNLMKVIAYQVDTVITSGISSPSYGFTCVATGTAGNLFGIIENHILKIDAGGNLLGKINTGETINSILFDTTLQQLLLFSDAGVLLYDTNLNFVSTANSGTGYIKGFKHGASYFLQNKLNIVEKVDAGWNLIHSAFADGAIRDMELDNDKIYVFVQSLITQPHFATFDTSLTLLDTFSIGRTDFTLTDFSVSDGTIHAVGSLLQHEQIFIYQQKFPEGSTSQFPSGSDIGITQLRLENTTQTYYTTVGNTVVYTFAADCYVTIRNFSADTIRNYYISSPVYGGMNCFDFIYNFSHSIIIPPLSSIDVFVTHISKELTANSYFRLCLFTVAPNFLPDLNISNDSACVEALITSVPNNSYSNPVSIYSNPFSSQLTFSLVHNKQTTVSLYSFLGQQVLQQAFINSITINTGQLADGIYFYELRDDKGVIETGKVVKQ